MEEKIIQEYLNGKSISALSKEYPFSYQKIRKILIESNISIRGGRKKKELSSDELQKLKMLYENGIGIAEIAKELGYSSEKITDIIREQSFERLVDSKRKVNKRLKENYFSNIDAPEKAYWLGFLFTDGCVDCHNGRKRIRLQLQQADKEILEKYKEDLGIDGKIIEDKRKNSVCYSVEIACSQIYDDLQKYGIIPRKTYETEHLPLNLIPKEYLTSFLLGMFDGDGSLSCSQDYSKDVTINFTSYHESIVKEFQEAIDLLINKTEHNKNLFTTAWHTMWRGRLQVIKILDILYENCPRHLQRKYEKYLSLKNSLN